jgi:hypothetical protein
MISAAAGGPWNRQQIAAMVESDPGVFYAYRSPIRDLLASLGSEGAAGVAAVDLYHELRSGGKSSEA